MTGDWRIPFDRDGNQLSWGGDPDAERWEDSDYSFYGTLEYVDYHRGRSSVTVELEDVHTGLRYSMTLMTFMGFVPELDCGRVSGLWGFKKTGSNVGIVRL